MSDAGLLELAALVALPYPEELLRTECHIGQHGQLPGSPAADAASRIAAQFSSQKEDPIRIRSSPRGTAPRDLFHNMSVGEKFVDFEEL